jgi:hypothetical protein
VRQTFSPGRGDACKRAACCACVALFVAAVSAALASPARGADETAPPAPPPVLKIASSATIAPDVPDTAAVADVSTPADETAVPADLDAPVIAAETPANQDGWVEVPAKPSTSHRVPKVIPVRARLHARPATTTAPAAVTQRHAVQYHPRPRQYHHRATSVRPTGRTSSLLASSQPARRGLSRAADEPASGLQSGDDICASEPSICPDVCSDDSIQNSLQNVAEIVRCIVNSALDEIGNSEDGSAPDSGLATPAPPAPAAEPDTSGQYQCEDLRYHDPACDSAPPAGSSATPPTSTPTPDAAPVAPPSGITPSPPAPSGAAPSSAGAPPVGAATPSNVDDGWELVHEPREQQPVTHVIAAAPRVRSTPVLETTHARVRHVRVSARPAVHTRAPAPAPATEGRPHVALARPAVGSSGSETGESPLRTAVALLALASLAMVLLAVARAYGGGTAVALRTRLGSKGLSAARRRRGDGERIRYRG